MNDPVPALIEQPAAVDRILKLGADRRGILATPPVDEGMHDFLCTLDRVSERFSSHRRVSGATAPAIGAERDDPAELVFECLKCGDAPADGAVNCSFIHVQGVASSFSPLTPAEHNALRSCGTSR
ncbi:MAG TPA: hypothetical protein VMS98_09685 [Thermoanaerobaculia bacterium]|nr:hypothetical protein [Thermoanaerobaculia bacterium]